MAKTTKKQTEKRIEAATISKLSAAGFSAAQIDALRELFKAS